MPNLAQIETTFAQALVDVTLHRPPQIRGSTRRFSVYRNNVAVGLLDALASRYPVVKRLVGDTFFRELARCYVAAEPPRSPVLLYYGETFPAFIAGFEPARPIPYLADIARIELARGLAYHAADMEIVNATAFAALDSATIAEFRVALHPSVSIIASSYPVYSIWKVNQNRAPVVPVSPWEGEAALVARPHYAVQIHKLAKGHAAFLTALAQGHPFAVAATEGVEDAPDFDVTQAFALLINAKIVTSFNPSTSVIAGGARRH